MEKVYVEPQVEAKNNGSGSYVAGCPVKNRGVGEGHYHVDGCEYCERTF